MPKSRKMLPHNILTLRNTGPKKCTKDCNTIKELFQLLFSEEMVRGIVRETNRKAPALIKDFKTEEKFTTAEMFAFLGLLIQAGVTKSSRENIKDLWENTSQPLYRATLARDRMIKLLRCIRFDNGATRKERLRTNKAEAISDTFMLLNANLVKCYTPGENVTVDEQLYGFRGRTGFTQYMPNKPAKYGIKSWWLNEAATGYPLKGQLYTGLAPDGEREMNQGERVVKDLCLDLFGGTGRNVTCDNFFTIKNLADILMQNKLSIL